MQRSLLAAQFDAALELKDAGSAITATGVGQVAGVNRVVNVGTGFLRATLIVDVDQLKTSVGDELVTLTLQGSTTADFSSDVVNLNSFQVGDTSAQGETLDSGIGRLQRSVMNTKDGVKAYPFLRISHRLAGTAPSVNYRAFLTKDILA